MAEGRGAPLVNEDGNVGVRVEESGCKESSSRALFVGLLSENHSVAGAP